MKESQFPVLRHQNAAAAEGGSEPNSPSSMVNQYRLEDEEEELVGTDVKDLLITVDNPESHVSAIETFVVYRVVTKVGPHPPGAAGPRVLTGTRTQARLLVFPDHTQ